MKKDLYGELGVSPDASDEEIGTALEQSAAVFARAEQIYLPAKTAFQKARREHERKRNAHRTLGDKAMRAAYDQSRAFIVVRAAAVSAVAATEGADGEAGLDVIIDQYIARLDVRIERSLIKVVEGRPELKEKVISRAPSETLVTASLKLHDAISTESQPYYDKVVPAFIKALNDKPKEMDGWSRGYHESVTSVLLFLGRLLQNWPEETACKLADFLLDNLQPDLFDYNNKFIAALDGRLPDKCAETLVEVYLSDFIKHQGGVSREYLTNLIKRHPAVGSRAFDRLPPEQIAEYRGLRSAIYASVPPASYAPRMATYYASRGSGSEAAGQFSMLLASHPTPEVALIIRGTRFGSKGMPEALGAEVNRILASVGQLPAPGGEEELKL